MPPASLLFLTNRKKVVRGSYKDGGGRRTCSILFVCLWFLVCFLSQSALSTYSFCQQKFVLVKCWIKFAVFQSLQNQPWYAPAETPAPTAATRYPTSVGWVLVPWGFTSKLRHQPRSSSVLFLRPEIQICRGHPNLYICTLSSRMGVEAVDTYFVT